MTLLSIVIPTMPGRESLLSRCLHSITGQRGDYEVIVVGEPEGLASHIEPGPKIEHGYRAAAGEYVSVVDDDDEVAADYIERIATEAEWIYRTPEYPALIDYIGFGIRWTSGGVYQGTCWTSGGCKVWGQPCRSWQRCPVPKGVIRTELARKATNGAGYDHDRQWSAEASALVKTWVDIDRVLYFYDDQSGKWGAGRDVGQWPFDESKVTRLEMPS